MSKKHDVPISLFSFQDIITSLIGVMIIFVLLFAIEFLQTQEKQLRTSAHYDRIMSLINQKKLAEEDLEKINELYAKQVRRELDIIANDPIQLQAKINARSEEKDKLLVISEEKKSVEGILKQKISLEYSKNDEIAKDREDKTQELDSLEENEQHNIDNLTQEKKRFEKRLEDARRHLDIVFDSVSFKKPLLIQCSEETIEIGVYGENSRKSFPIDGSNYQSVFQYVSDYSSSGYYLVVLVKPSFAQFFDDFFSSLEKSFPNHEKGAEPIFENEDCI